VSLITKKDIDYMGVVVEREKGKSENESAEGQAYILSRVSPISTSYILIASCRGMEVKKLKTGSEAR